MNSSIRKENVLMLSPFFRPNTGGVETILDNLCEYLRKNNHEVFVITYQPLTTRTIGPKLENRENLEIRRIKWFGHNLFHMLEPYPLLEFIYLTPVLLGYSIAFLLSHRTEIDVIHGHGLNAAFVSKVLATLFNKKSVANTHAIYNLPKRGILSKLMRIILSSFDSILSQSNRSKIELTQIGLCSDNIKIFPGWVDQEVFLPLNKLKCKKDLNVEGKFVVLFAGRLIEKKGIRVLIEVAKRLNYDDILFVFVGDGPLAKELEFVSTASNNISYKGKIENRDLCTYYNSADLVVVPSLYEEGPATVILEALSCGTPVIASNKGAISEVLDSSVGAVIEPTISNVEQKVSYFYNNQNELLKVAVNCREYARQRFNVANAKLIEESYCTHNSPISSNSPKR